MKVLVVEDDVEVIETIILCITIPWPDTELIATDSGDDAIQLVHWLNPDVVLLDLRLADTYGLYVLREIRAFSQTPLVVITANHEETSRLASIQLGADDYLVKPFTHIDLLGSLKAAISRTHPDEVHHGAARVDHDESLIVNIPGRELFQRGAKIQLSGQEWRLLTALMRRRDGLVPYNQLGSESAGLEQLGPNSAETAFRSLSVKLSKTAAPNGLILSHEAEGYRLSFAS